VDDSDIFLRTVSSPEKLNQLDTHFTERLELMKEHNHHSAIPALSQESIVAALSIFQQLLSGFQNPQKEEKAENT
jgi:hypothetical protein